MTCGLGVFNNATKDQTFVFYQPRKRSDGDHITFHDQVMKSSRNIQSVQWDIKASDILYIIIIIISVIIYIQRH